MNKISIQYYKSPIEEMLLGSYDNKLCIAGGLDVKRRLLEIERNLFTKKIEEK